MNTQRAIHWGILNVNRFRGKKRIEVTNKKLTTKSGLPQSIDVNLNISQLAGLLYEQYIYFQKSNFLIQTYHAKPSFLSVSHVRQTISHALWTNIGWEALSAQQYLKKWSHDIRKILTQVIKKTKASSIPRKSKHRPKGTPRDIVCMRTKKNSREGHGILPHRKKTWNNNHRNRF
jgi:hypothetical protein